MRCVVYVLRLEIFYVMHMYTQSNNMDQGRELIEVTLRRPANVLVPVVLAYILSPGNFLMVPGTNGLVDLATGVPNRKMIATHAVILGAALALLRYQYPMYY